MTELTSTTQKSHKSEAISLVVVILLALAIRTFVFEIFYIPTASMKATILEGDYIFSTKYNYGYSIYSIPFNPDIFEGRFFDDQPQRGDVIIMRPPHDMNERYIKRLFGLPGDKVQIINDVIYINDQPVKRVEVGTYVDENGESYKKYKETLPNGVSYFSYKSTKIRKDSRDHSNYGPYLVENGRYFFIGDNRDYSGDSRYQLGTVPLRNFIAKGRVVVFSTAIPFWDSSESFFGQIMRFGSWFMSIRFNRLFNSMYETT